MPGKRLVASDKNWWKSKKDVVASMHGKLAGGPNIELHNEFKLMLRKKRKLGTIISASCISVAVIVYAIINWKSIETKLGIAKIFFREPVVSIDKDLYTQVITVDEYSTYMLDLLLYYDSLPSKYASSRVRFTTAEVHERLRNVWPCVGYEMQKRLMRELPFAGLNSVQQPTGVCDSLRRF